MFVLHGHALSICKCLIALQFSRTVAPDTSKGPALIAFMQHNKWRKIAMLSSTESLWFDTRQGLAKQLVASSIKVIKPKPMEPGDISDGTLSEIRRSGYRIVLVLAYEPVANTLASLAHRDSMSVGYAWLIVDSYLGADMQSWLYFRQFLASEAMYSFARQVSDYSQTFFDIAVSPDSVDLVYSAALHDAIMLYAHAATKVLSEGGSLRDGKAVTAAVRSTTFEGVGGTLVALDSNGDGLQSYEVMNYVVGEGNMLVSEAVGVYNCTRQQYRVYERAVLWPGECVDVPVDFFSGVIGLIFLSRLLDSILENGVCLQISPFIWPFSCR